MLDLLLPLDYVTFEFVSYLQQINVLTLLLFFATFVIFLDFFVLLFEQYLYYPLIFLKLHF